MNISVAGFEWDDGNWPKCAKHGVSMVEVEHVLMHGPAVFPDRGQATEERFNAIGRSAGSRFVVFTFRVRGENTLIRPISARYMHQKEVDHYEQRKDP